MDWVSNGFVFKRENHKNKDLFIEIAKIKYPAVLETIPLKNKSIRLN